MLRGLVPIIIILVIILLLVPLIKTLLKKILGEAQGYPYEKVENLFSPAERSFLGVLEHAVNCQYRFMGKVRLADIVKVKNIDKNSWQTAFNKIQSKHVDIVACDPSNYSVKFVIELDDKTHNESKRQERDQFVDNVLKAAKIPIIHFTAKRTYSMQDIKNILSQASPELLI